MERAIQKFLSSLATNRGSSDNTLSAYGNDLHQFLEYIQGEGLSSWAAVSSNHLLGYLLHMRDLEYAPATIARKLAAVKSFYHFLQATGTIESDPTRALTLPRVERYLPHALSPREIDTLFAQIATDTPAGCRDAAMFHLLYATGLRVSELVALNLEDLNLPGGFVRCVNRQSRTSTTSNMRFLPLPLPASKALNTYLQQGRPQLLRHPEEHALFLNHHGERLTRQGFWLIIKSYAKAAGVTSITPYTLRHSFAMHMLTKGADLHALKELLGHTSISSTQIYTQLSQATHPQTASRQRRIHTSAPARTQKGPVTVPTSNEG
jgi:integrase/recombinase XerD